MKAFLGSIVLLVGITVIASIALQYVDMSAKDVFTSQLGSVRN